MIVGGEKKSKTRRVSLTDQKFYFSSSFVLVSCTLRTRCGVQLLRLQSSTTRTSANLTKSNKNKEKTVHNNQRIHDIHPAYASEDAGDIRELRHHGEKNLTLHVREDYRKTKQGM